ncbi:MAG TPA: DNRLRE domain-containing protein [Planctomycetota bacterium]|nr:DNRLRE domain-containing protein [Planctomycetota bacterium]
MIRTQLSLVRALAALSLTLSAAAQTQVQIGASKDNTLYNAAAGNISNGAGEYFFVGRNAGMTAYPIRRGLIAFDVAAAVPAGALITSVELTLSMSTTIAGPKATTLHRLLQDWGEGGSDAPGSEGAGDMAQAGDATWTNTFYPSSNWSTLGGTFVAGASATLLVDQVGFYTWASTPQLVADVQGWLDAPATNFGWLIKGVETSNTTAKRFDSKDSPFPSLRPVLTIEYADGPSSYCAQSKSTSVPGCTATLGITNATLATGAWSTNNIPRDVSLGSGSVLGIYIFTHGAGIGQSGTSLSVPFGTLCLSGFKRSAPLCTPAVLSGAQAGVCNAGPITTELACNGGALGIAVGDDINVQLWYRDPTAANSGNASFSNAIFYTVQ